MSQNITNRNSKHCLRMVCVVILSGLMAGVFCCAAELSSEKLLASVMIDDLVIPTNSKDLSKTTTESEKAILEGLAENRDDTLQVKLPKVEFILNERLILDEIRHQIASHFELTDDFRIYFDRPWKEIKLNSPVWELVMTAFPSQGLRNRFFVSFELWVDGKRLSTWQEGVRCELWIDAYVATQQIDRGSVMREGLVAVKPVDSLSLYQGPVEIGTRLTDYVVVNGLKAGEPLFWRDLKERPLIEKNALIDVVAEDGLLKVTLKAKALEEGVKGQIIRIRNLQSFNDIQAEVIGVNQARVHF